MKRKGTAWGAASISAVLALTAAPLQGFANDVPAASPSSAPVSAGTSAAKVEEVDPSKVAISKDKAVQLAKAAIDIPEGYTLQGTRLNSRSYMGVSAVWTLEFVRIVNDRQKGNLSVAIDADQGSLLSFYSYDEDDRNNQSYPPKVDYEAAKKLAADALAKLAGDKAKLLRYDDSQESALKPPLQGYVEHNVRYIRTVNGYPFYDNGANFRYNGNGKLVGFDLQWTPDIEFSAGSEGDVIDSAEAAKIMNAKLKPVLTYWIPWNSVGPRKELEVVYQSNPLRIDAKSGEALTGPYYYNAERNSDKPLTTSPTGPAPKERKLSQSEAVERVNELFKLPADAELQSANFNEYTNHSTNKTQSSWNISWTIDSPEADKYGKPGIYATIDALTGVISNYSSGIRYWEAAAAGKDDAKQEFKLSIEQAQQKAVDLIKKNLPHLTHELYAQTEATVSAQEDQMARFSFLRGVHGILSDQESVNVTIDRVSGDVLEYWYNTSGVDYPAKAPDVIGTDKAKEKLLQQYELRLQYALVSESSAGIDPRKLALMRAAGEPVPVEGKPTAKLVYDLVQKYYGESIVLDAVTGEWRSGDTYEPVSLERPKATDLDGHWAATALQLMLDYKAVDVQDGLVRPNESITRGEMVKMLVIAMNGGYHSGMFTYAADRAGSFNDVAKTSAYFGVVERAVDMQLLDRNGENFEPERKITREEIAAMIVRALRYSKLAERENLFVLQAADADAIKQKGHAALVLGLGIMTLDEQGRFLPGNEVSRAAAATAFYRFLEQRAQLQDQIYY